jgi:transposase
MNFRITLSRATRRKLSEYECRARRKGDLQLLNRVLSIIAVSKGHSFFDVANILKVSVESIRLWLNAFLLASFDSFSIGKSSGRPSKLTPSEKKELYELIRNGPQAAGYMSGCWNSPMIQDLIFSRYGVFYSVFYLAEFLKNLGFSFQKSKFVSDHLNEGERSLWIQKVWPKILKKAEKMGSYILFGDEASFPQWGTLSYSWAPRGQQPTVKTSGKRKGYKVFGLIEYSTGKLFSKAQESRLNSKSYIKFMK